MTAKRQFVLVPAPKGRGYQVAELLDDPPPDRLRVRRWDSMRKAWLQPSAIAPTAVVGEVPVGDRRLADIAEVEARGGARESSA